MLSPFTLHLAPENDILTIFSRMLCGNDTIVLVLALKDGCQSARWNISN